MTTNKPEINISNYTPEIYETAVDFGDAASFDGIDDYVQVPNSSELELTDGTIEFWVKPDWAANSKNFNPAVLANRDTSGTRYSIHIRRNLNGVDLWNGSQVGTVLYNFEQGNWYHVALVETGTSTEVFINGEFQGSMSRGFSAATGKDFHIGSSDGAITFFEGEIDEVRIWNKARTQEEIQENLHTKLTGTEDGLAAYYNFDNDSGTTIIDGTGSNNGTLNNGDGNNLVGSNIGYTLTDWEVTETPVVKIAEGETEATITVAKIDDEIAEYTAETVTVTLNDSDNYDLDTSNQTATVTLNDDDEAGIEFAKLTTSDGTVVATSLEYYNNTVVTSEVATIELEVTSDYANGNVGLKIASGDDSYTLTAGTQLSFSDGALVTVDTDTTISTGDAVTLVPVTFVNAIATQETVSFTDEQSGTAIEVGVSTGYNPITGEVGLQISSGVDALTFSNGTELTFSNGAVVTLTQDTTISSSTETLVPVSFANQILSNETSEIELPGEDNTTFGVRLNSQPTDDVTLTLTIGDSTEGQFANSTSTQTLNFTTENWDTYQEVTLYGVDDDIDDDAGEDENSNTVYDYSIDVTTTSQNDSNYNLQISDAVFVNNQDNESTEDSNNNVNTNNSATNIASINVINSELSEDGSTTAEFEINLSEAAPEGGVYVKYEIGDGTGTIGDGTGTIGEDIFAYTLIGDDNPLNSYSTGSLSNLFLPGSSPIFVDIDGDEDLDVFIGRSEGTFRPGGIDYYENTGDKSNPIFTERTSSDNPLNQVSLSSNVPSFVDIDNDGDLDAFVGYFSGALITETISIDGSVVRNLTPTIYYYENTGNYTNPVFERRTGSDNPLEELIHNGNINQPITTFGDMDNDGDFDIFVGAVNGGISYFENIGSAESPIFQRLGGSNNPFNGIDFGDDSAPTLVDFDSDGDLDAFIGRSNGTISYYLNSGTSEQAVFVEQTTPINFDVGSDSRPSIVDIDNDGYFEAFVGEKSGNINLYAFNPIPEVYIPEGNTKSSKVTLIAVDDLIDEQQETFDIRVTENVDDTLIIEITSNYESNSNGQIIIGEQPTINYFVGLKINNAEVTDSYFLTAGTVLNFTDSANNTYSVTINENTVISNTSTEVGIQQNISLQGIELVGATTSIINSDYIVNEQSSTGTFEIVDNDIAGLNIVDSDNNPLTSLTTSEDGITETFYVSLDTKPTDNVAVYFGVDNSEEGLLSDDNESNENLVKLVFSPDNWDTSQAVTLTSVDDDVDDSNITYNIISTVISEDIKYNEDNVILKLTEDFNYVDGSSNTISLLVDDLSVQETELAAGTQLTFANGMILEVESDTTLSNSIATNVNVTQVQAANQILKNTTAFIDEDNSNLTEYLQIIVTEEYADGRLELQIDESSSIASVDLSLGQQLTFSNGTVFTVEVAETLSNAEASTIFGRIDSNLLKVATTEVSTGSTAEVTTDYTDKDSGKTEVIVNTDYNEAAGTVSLRINDTTASEVELVAGTQIDFSNGAAVSLDNDVTLTTTASSVNVSGVGNEITTSFTESISTDISVTNNDNDTAAVVVDRYDISSLEGYGNNFFNLKLATQPLGEVTVTMNPVDVNGDKDYNISLADEFDGESYSVTFDETNWNLAKAIRVQAVDDYDIEYNHSSYIDFTVSSDEDSIYDGVTPTGDVVVKIEDNDLPTASIQAVAAASEAGSPGYFIVSLDNPAPDGFDGTGIVVNYSVSGTVDRNVPDKTDDLKALTGSVRIAPGETRSPIIAFPIDDFKVEAIPLEVLSAAGNNVRLQINTAKLSDSQKQSLIEVGTVPLNDDTELTFSNGAIAEVNGNYNLQINANGSVTSVNAAVEFTSDITTVAIDETTSIPQETVVVTLSSGSDYSINENEPPSAILSIQDNDTPGVRIVEIGDTTVTENGTSEFYISLLSQPEADVTIALNGVPTERKLIVDQAYSNTASTIQLKVDDSEVDSLLLPAGTYTLGNAEVTVSSDTTIDISDKFTEVALSSISSNITASDSLTYSYTELGFDDTYTFNSDNWYKLQTVTVKGIDDSVAETGDFHSSTVGYTISSTDTNYDGFEVPPQTINIIDRTFDSENTTESLVEGLFALQDGLDSVTLPVIGKLDGVAPSFIEDFIDDLVEEVKQTEYVTAESLQDAFNNVLSDRFGMVNVEITDLSTENIEFKLNIEDSFNKSITLNGDLGLPALGINIESDGDIETNFDYKIDLGFGISTDDGFYINTEDTGFDVGASLSLSDEFTATGKLAFLQIEATNGDEIGGTNIDAEFTINLEDADTSDDSNDEDEKKLTLTELNNLRKSDNLFDSIKYGFSGDAALDLDVVTSIKGNTGFPSLGLNISSELPLFNYSNTDEEDEDENVKLTVVSSSATSLNIESSDSTNIVRLNKDTELKFGNTTVIVKEDTDIEPGEETTVNVTLADGSQGTINNIAADTIIETPKIPLLTISSSRTSQEGKITTLDVTSNNENIIRLKKDTELNFGGTRVILKKVIISEGDVDINSELIDIQPGDTPTTIEVSVVGDKDNNSGEFLTIDEDTTADVSVGEILDSDPSLTLSQAVTSKEGESITLQVTSNNVTDTIQLNKGTQLKFGDNETKFTLEETAYIESGNTPSEIKVTVADDGDETTEESVTITKDKIAELVSSEFNLSFNDITLDTGGFITDLMSPVINYVNDLIEPFEPIIDVLQTEIKFLDTVNLVDLFDENNDGSATLIEVASYLASTFSGTDLKYQEFFNAVTGIIDLVDTLKDLESDINSGENLSINFGDYTLENFKGASDDEEDSASNTDTEESGGDELNSDTKEQAENSGTGSIGTKITNFFSKLDELGISIPLIEDPFIAVNLLLGQDIDLVTYDIPELDIGFKITQEFPIFGSITGLLEGAFSLSSDLVVGFDTYGFSRWEDKGFDLKDSHLIFDGFYLSDVDPDTGKDVDELTMDATIAAGVSASAVVAKAELTGGITGKAGLDIIDGGEFTGESDGKLRGSEVLAADSLFDLFSLSGSLKAFIKAVVKVGVDVGLFEVMKTVWKEKFSITLFEFELGGSSGTVSQSYIEGATVFFDSNLDGIWQEGEPFTLSNADGSYNLEIPLLFFDTNDNGKIDPEEGRIVTEGGTDSSSGVEIETPLIAPYGAKMVTPLTTLKQKLIEDGSTPEEAEQLIKEALEIPEDINLEEFDALDAMSKGDERGSKVYKAHVQVQSLFAQTSEYIKGFGKDELVDEKRPIPEQAIDAIAKGFKKRKGKGKGRTPINFSDSAELEELIKEPLEGKFKSKAERPQRLPESFGILTKTVASGNKEIDEVFEGVPPKDILGKVAPVKKKTQDKLPKELRKLAGGARREDITSLLERVPEAEQFLLKEQSEPGDKPPVNGGEQPDDKKPLPIVDSEDDTIIPIAPRKPKKLAKGKRPRNLLELDGDDLTDTKIKFSLSSKNLPEGRIHEIAIFTTEDEEGSINGINPEDAGYKEAALKKSRSIFSILPDDFIANPKRIMKGFADKNIGFLLIKNGTVDSARRGRTPLDNVLVGTEQQGDGFRGMQISEKGENSFRLSFEDEMGDADFTDIVIDAELTDETPEIVTDIQGESEGEMLDLREYEGKQIQIQAPIVREESAYENVVGFYVVEDTSGAVRDPLTGDLINPGEEGYIKAALRNSQNNAFQMGEKGIGGNKEIRGGQIFAPFAIANGTLEQVLDDNPDNDPQVYFAHIGANTDRVDYIRNLGGNTWGVEDMRGGGDMDFNDIVFKLDVTVG
ncbi:hypothetical protein NIES267_38090 [Calothrix parasitica NIES-267]|uniref:DUF4114 domain-containing protein n=1 Tax=Calothrix parasitica NIES-267 TaxID=1973488 RepID=A0A1Z4LSU0_9CYAN|nr:hypothetical protein NIES267_38090 [Calothrix parasitica NIES-267]